jgi:hypothetical protein
MSKTLILWVIGAVVVIAVGGYFIINGTGGGSMMSSTGTSTASASSSGTMMALLARGGSSQCQISDPSNGTSGTVFVGDGKMRADFSGVQNGKTVTSHMISDGTTEYMWSSAMAEGIKMSAVANATTSAPTGTPQSNPANETVNYTCSTWTVDSSEFSLPAGITFQDLSAMIQGAGASVNAGAGASTGASAECNACNQITNAAQKAQCKAALHC